MRTCSRESSALIVIDFQDSFLAPIPNKERILERAKFLIEAANVLGIPIIATEQYATRMGGTTEAIAKKLGDLVKPIDKLCFSCFGSESFQTAIANSRATQMVITGIETHICVCQTAMDLLEAGHTVFVAADAVTGRIETAHQIAIDRMACEGCKITHTESVVYEWLKSADVAEFKAVLNLVKQYAT